MATKSFRPIRAKKGMPQLARVLVICDGAETEPNYFTGLKRRDEVAKKAVLIVRSVEGKNRDNAIRKLVSSNNPDETWCIFDTEVPADRAEIDRIEALAAQHSAKVFWSNPAFEVWVLAHFARPGCAFYSCDAVIDEIDKYWQKLFGAEYSKIDKKIFQRLEPHTAKAVENCRWVNEHHHGPNCHTADCNSSSSMCEIVGRFF
ncbi:MAG: RloB family protein [Verrucomicrobiales bacterium]|nr:RloB family protein [Verrucomicrobiales bacterium]